MLAKLSTKIALRKAGLPTSFPDSSNLTGGNAPATKSKDRSELLPFANPFTNLQVPTSLKSWQTPLPPAIDVAAAPALGTRAPTSNKLRIPVQDGSGRPSIVVFMRYAGCPFAEKTFLELRRLANKYPQVSFIAISHCSRSATDKWINLLGGAWAINIIIDQEREVYASWGLGVSTTWHLMNPWTQVAARKLGNEEGIWARDVPADGSANRWIVGGAWACDESELLILLRICFSASPDSFPNIHGASMKDWTNNSSVGSIRWGGPNKTADDIPNLEEAVRGLGIY